MEKNTDIIFENIENFNEFRSHYKTILERINNFVANVGEGKVAENSLAIFIKTLGGYKDIVQKEIENVKLKVTEAENSKDKSQIALINKTLGDLNIIFHNINNTYIKYKDVKGLKDLEKINHTFLSMEDIVKTEKKVKDIRMLVDEYFDWNKKRVNISLCDKLEAEKEKFGKDFLDFEYNYLTTINNMQFKINENLDRLENLSGFMKSFKKNFLFSLKKEYVIDNEEVANTSFGKDFNLFNNYCVNFFSYIDGFEELSFLIENISKFKHPIYKEIENSFQSIISKEIDIVEINKELELFNKKYKLLYVLDVLKLLKNSPFEDFNNTLSQNIYDETKYNLLKKYCNHYFELKKQKNFSDIQELGLFSDSIKVIEDNFIKSIDKNITIVNKASIEKKDIDIDLSSIIEEKNKIENLINNLNLVSEEYKKIKRIKKNLLEEEINYDISFEKDYVYNYINTELEKVLSIVVLEKTNNDFLNKVSDKVKLVEEKLNSFMVYIKETTKEINRLVALKDNIKDNIYKIEKSYENIKSYSYSYGDTISNSLDVIKIEKSTVPYIYDKLYKLFEEEYNEGYEDYQEEQEAKRERERQEEARRERARRNSYSSSWGSSSSSSSSSSRSSSWGSSSSSSSSSSSRSSGGGFSSGRGGFSSGGTGF